MGTLRSNVAESETGVPNVARRSSLVARRSSLVARRSSLVASCWLLAVAAALGGETVAQQGAWVSSYQHPTNGQSGWPQSFNAIHLAVIPGTSDVIAWDLNSANNGLNGPWPQRFVVGNPETGTFTNYTVGIPSGFGDLFCAGHIWLPDGRLFVAGGNTVYATGPQCSSSDYFAGSQFVGIWNPNDLANGWHGWNADLMERLEGTQPGPVAMNLRRWYPTVTMLSDTLVMVAGGVERTDNYYCNVGGCGTGVADPAMDTYEVFDLSIPDWVRVNPALPPGPGNPPKLYNGPSPGPAPTPGACGRVLGEYPRLHLVSTNQLVMTGMFTQATKVRHDPFASSQNWLFGASSGQFRGYGTSVLLPNVGNTPGGRDLILTFGGGFGSGASAGVHGTSRQIDGGASTSGTFVWGLTQSMVTPRMVANGVLMPNGSVVAVGGSSTHYFEATPTPVRTCEVYDKVSGWTGDAQQVSARMYHSTAALLPSGNLVSAGGDVRTSDWEVYVPRYFTGGQTIPQFAGGWSGPGTLTLQWGSTQVIPHGPLPVGVTISRLVLMRPCSVTHHSDMDQRYVELEFVFDEERVDEIEVRLPNAPNFAVGMPNNQRGLVPALPGYYMAFLITSQGTPSSAKWVRLP
jgi:hypothetical protein